MCVYVWALIAVLSECDSHTPRVLWGISGFRGDSSCVALCYTQIWPNLGGEERRGDSFFFFIRGKDLHTQNTHSMSHPIFCPGWFVITVVSVYENGLIRQAAVRRWLNELGQCVSHEYISIIQMYRDTGLEKHHLTEISDGFLCVLINYFIFCSQTHTACHVRFSNHLFWWHESCKEGYFFIALTVKHDASKAKMMGSTVDTHSNKYISVINSITICFEKDFHIVATLNKSLNK